MLKHIGIAAVSAEGAALCYRTICAEGAALLGPHTHPEITMHTPPFRDHVRAIEAGRWDEVAELLLRSAHILARGGADFVICPDNTAHQAFNLFMTRSPLPWLHIAGEVAAAAKRRGFRRIGILGTRFLMEGPVYPEKLAALGLEHRIPGADDRERINRIIFDELVYGRFENAARRFFQDAIVRLQSAGCDAVALACTEIPLLIGETDSALPTLDSTRILARAALREAASERSY
jgi:aspartate racemase